jgi:hypothetical protein
MNDPKSLKIGPRPSVAPPARPSAPGAVRPGAAGRPGTPAPELPGRSGGAPQAADPAAPASGKVRHDERGNAVWDFLAQTSRICIEATSRLLKRLEAPELKMEDTKDEELRIAPEPSTGGGYDPYNQVTKPPKPGRK